jgi:hypothetical protein
MYQKLNKFNIGRYCKGAGKIIVDDLSGPLCEDKECATCNIIREALIKKLLKDE